MKFNQEDFVEEIDSIVWQNDLNYIDAVVLYCERHNVDVTDIVKKIPESIRAKIQLDANKLNLLKDKVSTLKIKHKK